MDLYQLGYENPSEKYKEILNTTEAFFSLHAYELEYAIEEIDKPIKLAREQTEKVLDAIVTPKKDTDYPELIVMWIIYIAVMISSLIFNEFYILWIIATVIFWKLRKDIIG